MSQAFSDIAFTPAVRAMQTRMGSRKHYARLDESEDRRDQLSQVEIDFIGERDSFYQATVSETGWPYVQFRGGPAGFLKVLDEKTIGYADFRGNVQYISAGNVAGNDRVAIILMDYANRRRLKILGRVRIVELAEDPDLVAQLESPHYRARIERAVIIRVEGYDWNCPQHITPRFTEAEWSAASSPPRAKPQAKSEVQTQLVSSIVQSERTEIQKSAGLGRRLVSLTVGSVLALTTSVVSAAGAIVLAHGKRDVAPYALDPVVQTLRSQGYTVVTPDMPWSATRGFDAGHGDAIKSLSDAVTQLRDAGANPVFVGGHGLGANTALAVAATVKVDGVVLIAPAHTPDVESFAAPVRTNLLRAQDAVARNEGTMILSLLDFDHRATHEIRIRANDYVSYFQPDGTAAMSLSAARVPPGVPVLWIYGLWDVVRDEGQDLFFSHLPANKLHRRAALLNVLGNTPKSAATDIAVWLSQLETPH